MKPHPPSHRYYFIGVYLLLMGWWLAGVIPVDQDENSVNQVVAGVATNASLVKQGAKQSNRLSKAGGRSPASISSPLVEQYPVLSAQKKAEMPVWIERSLQKYQKTAGLPNEIQDYTDRNQHSDPLSERFKVDHSIFHNEESGFSVRSWRDKKIYHKPSDLQMNLYVSVECHDECGQIESIRANVFDLAKSQQVASIGYKRSTREANQYSASLPLKELHGRYWAKIVVQMDDGEIRLTEAFDVWNQPVVYANKMRDDLDSAGNLRLGFLLDSKKAGYYLLECSILNVEHEMLAKVESFKRLEAGNQWGEISVHGSYFYQKKMDGPFYVSSITIKEVDPNTLNSFGDSYFTVKRMTNLYQWEEFNRTPYVNRVITDKIKMFDSTFR